MAAQPTYGPHNPHPLSTMRTDLVWEDKCDVQVEAVPESLPRRFGIRI